MSNNKALAGKYELVALLARGGMGAVYRARHIALDVEVAVKLMSPLLAESAEQRARFAREARAAAQIKSPHVVQIYDHGVEGDTPYIVMELLVGEDLGARLRRETKLTLVETASLLRQMTRGLRKAHEIGVVHRDLKPANIFLARGDEEGPCVKILDFGIARATAGGDSTLTGEILGSPPYMSPEQARGLKCIDHRTDQWSLAVVAFRMLTGRLPFQAEHACDVLVKICTESAPLLSSVAPDLPRGLDAVFARAFERDPERRFASIREFSEAFHFASVPAPLARSSERTGSRIAFFPHVPVGRTTVRLADVSESISDDDEITGVEPHVGDTAPLDDGMVSQVIETAPLNAGMVSQVIETAPLDAGVVSQVIETAPLDAGMVSHALATVSGRGALLRTAPPVSSRSVMTPLPFVLASRPSVTNEAVSDVPTGSGAMTRPISQRRPTAGGDVSLLKAGVFALCAFVGATMVWMVRTARLHVVEPQITLSAALAQPPAATALLPTATLASATSSAMAPSPTARPTSTFAHGAPPAKSSSPRPGVSATATATAEATPTASSKRVIYDDPK